MLMLLGAASEFGSSPEADDGFAFCVTDTFAPLIVRVNGLGEVATNGSALAYGFLTNDLAYLEGGLLSVVVLGILTYGLYTRFGERFDIAADLAEAFDIDVGSAGGLLFELVLI